MAFNASEMGEWTLAICDCGEPRREGGVVYSFTVLTVSHTHCVESRWLATPERWRFVRNHDKPMLGSCATYFPGGIGLLCCVCMNDQITELVPLDQR